MWVYEPQVGRNQIAFVGQGSATTEVRARVLAYESILSQISEYIGEDVTGTHIAQLSSRGAIEQYRLKVTQEFIKIAENPQGPQTVYFLAVADRNVLETARTESEVQLLETQRELESLAAQAAQMYRENKDLLAISLYLKIAYLAKSLPIERGSQWYLDAIERVRKILQPLTLSVATGNPSVPTTEVTLRRGGRALSPRVVEARVIARSEARDGMGDVYDDSQRFVTDQNGQFAFLGTNPAMIARGVVTFEIDLAVELEPLRAIDSEAYGEFMALIDAKQVGYPYVRTPIVGTRPLVVAVHEYSLQGQLLDSTHAARKIMQSLGMDGLDSIASTVRPAEDENYVEDLRAAYPNNTYALYGNAGVSQSKLTERGAAVTVTGEVSLVNLANQARSGSSGTVVANALAPTVEEAQKEAFSKFGSIVTSLMYRFLYR